jgi:hypothetical protein
MAPALAHGTDFINFTRDITALPMFQKVALVDLNIFAGNVPLGDGNPMFNIHTDNLIKVELAHKPPPFGNITEVQPLASTNEAAYSVIWCQAYVFRVIENTEKNQLMARECSIHNYPFVEKREQEPFTPSHSANQACHRVCEIVKVPSKIT